MISMLKDEWFSILAYTGSQRSCTTASYKLSRELSLYRATCLNMFYIYTHLARKANSACCIQPIEILECPSALLDPVCNRRRFANSSKGGVKNRSLGAGRFLIFACKNVRPPSKVAKNLRPLLKVVQTLRPSECFIFNEKVTLICKINIFHQNSRSVKILGKS